MPPASAVAESIETERKIYSVALDAHLRKLRQLQPQLRSSVIVDWSDGPVTYGDDFTKLPSLEPVQIYYHNFGGRADEPVNFILCHHRGNSTYYYALYNAESDVCVKMDSDGIVRYFLPDGIEARTADNLLRLMESMAEVVRAFKIMND